jgi:hypothetical protein
MSAIDDKGTSYLASIFYFLFIYWAEVKSSPLLLLIIRAVDDNSNDFGAISRIYEWQGKPKYSEKICPSAAVYNRSHMT